MSPHIEKLRAEMAENRTDAESLVAGLSDRQLQWHPRPGSWSIVECLAHLNTVDGQDLPVLYREITMGRRNSVTSEGPFWWNWLERAFIWGVNPPAKVKVRAPKKYLPSNIFNAKETILEFLRIQHDLYYLAAEADGLDLKKIKVVSPAAKWLKMSLGARLDLIAAHDRRHLWQARKVRDDANFPKS
jgi:hypothetical protein